MPIVNMPPISVSVDSLLELQVAACLCTPPHDHHVVRRVCLTFACLPPPLAPPSPLQNPSPPFLPLSPIFCPSLRRPSALDGNTRRKEKEPEDRCTLLQTNRLEDDDNDDDEEGGEGEEGSRWWSKLMFWRKAERR